jgi:sugar O-acyltransferase (sialic acid O-acetyltransferase NeuD family)
MVVVGAGGHAKEVIDVLIQSCVTDDILLFDNISENVSNILYDKFVIIKNDDDLSLALSRNSEFVLGLGGPYKRRALSQYFERFGGKLTTVIFSSAKIGGYCVCLEEGLNIMNDVVIYSDVSIGRGSLINTACSIHHDARIGEYCELSPGSRILGNAKIGNYCFVGANAVVLPNIEIGDNVIIGAGAVITKNIPSKSVVVGVPGKIIKRIEV